MLLRIHLQVASFRLAERLTKLLTRPDILVFQLEADDDPLERCAAENSNLLVISQQLFTEPVRSTIAAIRDLPDHPEVIAIIDRENAMRRAELLGYGCLAVLYGRLPDHVLQSTLNTLIQRRHNGGLSELQVHEIRQTVKLDDFISVNPAMIAFMKTVRRVIDADTSLLILGETGVGKERLARAIHAESPRSDGPFITVHCAALPETLLESELFGHVQGAFTGAVRSRRGYFELAHRGTIFLDEIGELTPYLQVKMLRVLQDHIIQRVGSEHGILVDVRVMAATNRDLLGEVAAHRFRKDLYYRLGVVTLTVPPLKERREDIAHLVDIYLAEYKMKFRRQNLGISLRARNALQHYSWPGNVRELINVIERAVLLSPGDEITPEDLPAQIQDDSGSEERNLTIQSTSQPIISLPPAWLEKPWQELRQTALDQTERAYLEALLALTRGKIGETAQKAGLSNRALYEKMRYHNLNKEHYRCSDKNRKS